MALNIADPMDIDTALINALNNFTVLDENGNPQKVPVIYVLPEGEIVVEQHPSLVLYAASITPDIVRISNNSIYSNQQYDTSGNLTSVSIRDDADPYVMDYDIRVYTLFEQDSKQLVKNVMTTFPLRGILNVNGMKLSMDMFKVTDLTKAFGGRLNSSSMKILEQAPQREQVVSMRYRIYTAFDTHTATTYKIAGGGVQSTTKTM